MNNNNTNYKDENLSTEIISLGDIVETYVSNQFGKVKPFIIRVSENEVVNDFSCVNLTLNNPLGKAIIGKKIGEVASYYIGDINYKVMIIKKYTLDELKKVRKRNN